MNLLKKLSFYTALSLTLLMLAVRLTTPARNVLSWDVMGYYMYLPATFIHHDLTLKDKAWVDTVMDKYHATATFYQAVRQPDGRWVMRYTSGLAVLNLPFFLIAHQYAGMAGYEQDGFSQPYQWGIVLSSLFYAIIGLWLFRKFLLYFFNDKITALLLLLIVLATNYWQVSIYAGTLAHNYLFFLYALLLVYTYKWHQKNTYSSAFIIGISVGLITLIRPNELVVILIPLLWGITSFKGIWEKIQLIFRRFPQVIVLGIGLVLGGCIQLIYWKYSTGKWLYYSYQDPGVGFDFKTPHTADFLFSFRKGWFIYTPLMAFAVLGFYSLYKRKRELFWPILAYFIINLYIVSSWSVWWYAGGSFSSRSLVSSYALMALPLGYFIQWIIEKGKATQIVSAVTALFLIALNFFQTWQFNKGILDGERITAAYYFRVFGKTKITDEDKKLLLVERATESVEHLPPDISGYSRKELGKMDFETDGQVITDSAITSKVFVMDSTHQFTRAIEASYTEITSGEYGWIKATADVFVPADLDEDFPLLVVSFHYKDQPYKYRSTEYLNPTLKKGQWNTVSIEYQTPEVRTVKDKLKVYMWYRGKKPVYVDNIEVESFEPKN